MEEEKYLRLIYKEIEGTASKSELSELEAWISESAENRSTAEDVREAWAASESLGANPEVNLDSEFDLLQARIQADESPVEEHVDAAPASSKRFMWQWYGVAAGIAAIIVVAFFAIPLLQAEDDPQWLTVSTSENTRQVDLPDGSTVLLNQNSSLSYQEENDSEERKVKLEGEAFFEVAHNPARPFKVLTATEEVTVLGTSFNVRNYADEPEKRVQVATGKVRFKPLEAEGEIILEAGERAVYDAQQKSLKKVIGASENELAWRTRKLVFKDQAVDLVLKEVEGFYGVTVTLEMLEMGDCPFTGTFHDRPVTEVLESVAAILEAELVEVKEGHFVLNGGSCD